MNGRYEVQAMVGTGGMADVYRARDNKLQRMVAIKVLKEEYSTDSGFVAKFRREAQAAGGLSHPNIVSVYDVGEQDGMYYIVMELVEGITLKKYIDKKGRLEEREAVEVAMQVAKGLEAAHDQGIIHRDIKPQNIIISKEGKIKVADFGIARVSTTETITANTMGSVHYISPEQARGGYCDERSDIYSLGITLYEMMTGTVPFDGESSVVVALKHIQDPIVPPGDLNPEISRNLEKIILKCTQKKPEYRYGSMASLLADFRRLLTIPDADFVKINPAAGLDALPQRSSGGERVSAAAAAVKAEGAKEVLTQLEEDKKEEEKAKKTERILSYIMMGIGVLIVGFIAAIILRGCSIFKTDETSSEAPRQSESQTAEPVPVTLPSSEAVSTEETEPTTPEESTTEEETTEEESTESPYAVLPDLKGMNYLEAMTLLSEMGLVPDVEGVYSSEYEALTIYEQSYPPETTLLKGTSVKIWVALPTSTAVIIPTVAGMTPEEATRALIEKGLVVDAATEHSYSDTVPAGQVANTTPSMGTSVDLGSTVTLVISDGPESLRLPAVLGRTKEEAIAVLTSAGFNAGRIRVNTETIESTYPADTVALVEMELDGYRQAVQAHTKVSLKADLILTLSNPYVLMPEVLGRDDVEDVITQLTELGLVVETVDEYASTYPVGQICWVTEADGETDIAEGQKLDPGTVVLLHISEDDPMATVPEVTIGGTVKTVKKEIEKAGLVPVLQGGDPADEKKTQVTAVSPAPGERVEKGSEVTIEYVNLVKVPAVSAGMTVAEVKKLLEDAGLAWKFDGDAPADDTLTPVSSISPASGETVPEGSEITILFGDATETYVPAIELGKATVDEAQYLLRKAGLSYKYIGDPPKHPDTAIVTKIDPKSGAKVALDTKVTLYYEEKGEETTAPTTETPTETPTQEPTTTEAPPETTSPGEVVYAIVPKVNLNSDTVEEAIKKIAGAGLFYAWPDDKGAPSDVKTAIVTSITPGYGTQLIVGDEKTPVVIDYKE